MSDQPFLVDSDMDYVVVTPGDGLSYGHAIGMTTHQAQQLIDHLGDAIDQARRWRHTN